MHGRKLTRADMDMAGLSFEVEETAEGVRLRWWHDGTLMRSILISPAQYQALVDKLGSVVSS